MIQSSIRILRRETNSFQILLPDWEALTLYRNISSTLLIPKFKSDLLTNASDSPLLGIMMLFPFAMFIFDLSISIKPCVEYFSGTRGAFTLYSSSLFFVFGPIAIIVLEFNRDTKSLMLLVLRARLNSTSTAFELRNAQIS